MKVIKKGNPSKKEIKETNPILRVNCKNCGAELELVPKDVRNVGFIFPSFAFECPECQKMTGVRLRKTSACFRDQVWQNAEFFE